MRDDAGVLLDRIDDDIAVVRLDRPFKRNALDSATLQRVNGLLDTLAADDTLRALVLSTTETRAFCAGADVGEPLDHDAGVARMAGFTRLYAALDAFPVPIVAVCVGSCVGAGAEIAAAADLRVGGDNLAMAWVGAALGVPVGPARLVPLVGVAHAKDLVFTGRVVGQAEAQRLGLIHRGLPADHADDGALELARTVAGQSGPGVRELKAMFRGLGDTAERVAYENERLMRFQQDGPGLPRGR